MAKPTDPTRDGYTFDRWYTDEATTQAYDFATPVTANLTLYAKWTADAVETFTVTFHTDEGSPVESLTVNKDATISQPEDPRKSNYIFVDWYTDEATTRAYDFATPVTANLTLYAKWATDAATLANDIVFASLTDTTKTVIGMREFLLTVTYNNLTNKDNLVFIVGESATPPAWSAVENHPAKITRAFDNAEKQIREIYFSATEKLPDDSPLLTGGGNISVDLSQATTKATEKDSTQANAKGIMIPGETYYVHVYQGGVYLKSQAVSTQDYPDASAFPTQYDDTTNEPFSSPDLYDYLWGAKQWYNKTRKLEMRVGEFVLLPVRLMSLYDATKTTINVCSGAFTGKSVVEFSIAASQNSNFVPTLTLSLGPLVVNEVDGSSVSFANSPQLNISPASKRNQVYDVMSSYRLALATTDDLGMQLAISCFAQNGLNPLSEEPKMTFRVVVE